MECLTFFSLKMYINLFLSPKTEYFYALKGKMTTWTGKLEKENGFPLIC